VFLVGPGFFLPLEQEVARSLAACRAVGVGTGPLLRRAALLGGTVVLALVVVAATLRGRFLDELFDGEGLLLVGFGLSLVGYFAEHLVRGALAGAGRFPRYGVVLGTEGAFRLVACAGLALAGVSTAGPYGVALGAAPLVAALAGLGRHQPDAAPAPAVPLRALTASLGWLLAASLAAQILVNAGPLAVKVLATDREQAAAGRFLAGLVLARVPLFLFQAVQASVLPRFSELDATGRHHDLRAGVRRLVLAVAGISAVSVVGAATVGPWLVSFLFGSDFRLGRSDLLLLAAASGAYLLAQTLSQPLIALSSPARVAVAWGAGVVALAVTTAVTNGLLARVEWGFLLGAVTAACAMAALLVPLMGRAREHSAEELTATIRELPLEP